MLPAGVEIKTPSETNFFIIFFELFLIDKFAACLLCLNIETSLIAMLDIRLFLFLLAFPMEKYLLFLLYLNFLL